MKKLIDSLKRYIISGILVVVPIILTYVVIKFLFETIDNILQPLLRSLLGYYVYGLGVLTTVLVIILAGILTRNFVGSRLHELGDHLLLKLPLIRPIYSAAKQLLEALTMPSMKAFKEVVLVEYPRKGLFAMGFISNYVQFEHNGVTAPYYNVFVPSTPTPISGMVVLMAEDEIIRVNMTVEEGVKYLVSGGVVSPDVIRERIEPKNSGKSEVPS